MFAASLPLWDGSPNNRPAQPKPHISSRGLGVTAEIPKSPSNISAGIRRTREIALEAVHDVSRHELVERQSDFPCTRYRGSLDGRGAGRVRRSDDGGEGALRQDAQSRNALLLRGKGSTFAPCYTSFCNRVGASSTTSNQLLGMMSGRHSDARGFHWARAATSSGNSRQSISGLASHQYPSSIAGLAFG